MTIQESGVCSAVIVFCDSERLDIVAYSFDLGYLKIAFCAEQFWMTDLEGVLRGVLSADCVLLVPE
jgi:hypothetical protein